MSNGERFQENFFNEVNVLKSFSRFLIAVSDIRRELKEKLDKAFWQKYTCQNRDQELVKIWDLSVFFQASQISHHLFYGKWWIREDVIYGSNPKWRCWREVWILSSLKILLNPLLFNVLHLLKIRGQKLQILFLLMKVQMKSFQRGKRFQSLVEIKQTIICDFLET